jgi:tetratricopeptide (TPR) repeat protein
MAGQIVPALERVRARPASHRSTASLQIAEAKLLAAAGDLDQAQDVTRKARTDHPSAFVALEQHAALLVTLADAKGLDEVVAELQRTAPDRAATSYYAAVARMLREDFTGTAAHANRAIALDPTYAATYDLLGVAQMKLGQAGDARKAFETSLRYNRRDSTAYANLGILELEASKPDAAAGYFAEALWLDPDLAVARQGLEQPQSKGR